MGTIVIRPATASDIPAITGIYRHAVVNGTASYELEPPGECEMAERFARLTSAGYPWLVAEQQGAILGYAYAGQFRPRRAYRFVVEDSIYVDPAAQKKGVGAKLLEKLLAEVEVLGFRQVIAVIGDGSNHKASVRVHERAGFLHAGKVTGTGFKHGRWLDTVFMQLPLNGGDSTLPDPDSLPERVFRESGKSLS